MGFTQAGTNKRSITSFNQPIRISSQSYLVLTFFMVIFYERPPCADENTGIQTVNTEKNAEGIFNLNGQKVMKTQKGLYIMNGKKVVIK